MPILQLGIDLVPQARPPLCSCPLHIRWFPGLSGSRSGRRSGFLLHPCPLWEGSQRALGGTAGFCLPGGILAPRESLAGTFHHLGRCLRLLLLAFCPSRMTHLHLSLWFSQKPKVCLLRCRLTCFFYKFLGITIDFWLRISKSYLQDSGDFPAAVIMHCHS